MGWRFILSVLLGCALNPGMLPAQAHAYLSGVIRDPSDAGVPGASVTVMNQDTGFRRLTSSHPDGSYAVVSLEAGLYKITVRRRGFRTLIRLGVRVDEGQPTRVDFILPLGSMQESITVEGVSAMLHTEDAAIGTVMGREEIERLSSNGHSLSSFLEFTPGTIVTPATRGEPGQFTSGGQRPNTNYFLVDGVSANTGVSAGGLPAQSTGGSLPAMNAMGGLQSLLSLEAVSEFRVQTSTTAPEFGRLPGGQIVLTSRSGSDEFHGSVFDSYRNEALDANNWFANRYEEGRAPTRMQDFGGSLGGPVRRDRTFFFLSYEGMRLRQPLAWLAAVPDVSVRGSAPQWVRPLLGLFPLPNGQGLGSGLAEWTGQSNRPSRFDAANLRIDHAMTSHVTLFGRYSQSPSWSQFGSTEVNQMAIDSRSLTFGVNVRLKPSWVVDLRMNASEASLHSSWGWPGSSPCDLQPVVLSLLLRQGACDSLLRFSIGGVGQIVAGSEGEQRQAQWHVAPAVDATHGAHHIRLGADYLQLRPASSDTNRSVGVIVDSLAGLMDSNDAWLAVSEPYSRHSVLNETSVFAQDTWRIHPRITASFGLRWEFAPPPQLDSASSPFQNSFGQRTAYGFSNQGTVWRRTYNNLAPRLGVAYRPFASGHTVLRAGGGIYYDSSLSIATDLVNGGPFSLAQYASAMHAPFSSLLSYGFTPDLHLPSVKQWSATIEQALGGRQTVSAAYEGSAGRQLLRRELGGFENTETLQLALTTNHGLSSYQGLQLQYRLRNMHGLSGLASYSWSHSIDNSSSDSVLYWAGSGLQASNDRGSSDFDVRHALNAAVSYEMPNQAARSFPSALLRGWGLDGILHARTGFPITVLDADCCMGLSFANVFRPNIVPGQPIWVRDQSVPGARRLNSEAFQPTGAQGNLGRNAIAGFGMYQIDLGLRREFRFGEQRSLQLRIDAFNALNHPNFADPVRFLSNPLFGQSASMLNMMLGTGSPGSGLTPMFQTGGPRSVQVTLRLRF